MRVQRAVTHTDVCPEDYFLLRARLPECLHSDINGHLKSDRDCPTLGQAAVGAVITRTLCSASSCCKVTVNQVISLPCRIFISWVLFVLIKIIAFWSFKQILDGLKNVLRVWDFKEDSRKLNFSKVLDLRIFERMVDKFWLESSRRFGIRLNKFGLFQDGSRHSNVYRIQDVCAFHNDS